MLVAAGAVALRRQPTILMVAAYLAWLAYDAIRNGSALSIERGTGATRQGFSRGPSTFST
jgi:threonine/homoserine/homoserine lactone efflux protein